jgi:hypothetical protein
MHHQTKNNYKEASGYPGNCCVRESRLGKLGIIESSWTTNVLASGSSIYSLIKRGIVYVQSPLFYSIWSR